MLNLLSNALKFTFDGSITVRVGREDTDATIVDASPTPGSEYPPRRCPGSSNASTASKPRAPGPRRAAESGWLWSKNWSDCTVAPSPPTARRASGTTFTVRLPFGAAHLPRRRTRHPRRSRAPYSGVIAEPYVQEALRWLPADADSTPPEWSTTATVGVTPAETATATATRVLVADDNADMREYLTNLLQTSGYQVSGVTDGQQALEAIRAQVPDLVISDVMMPRLDGLQLLAALRSGPAHRRRTGPAAVRARRTGSLDRGLAGRRRRLPRQTVRRRGSACAGARQHRAGAAAQPSGPLAHRPGRLAAGSVLRLRRARCRHRDQHRLHRDPRLRPRTAALPNLPIRGGQTPTPTPKPTDKSKRRSRKC